MIDSGACTSVVGQAILERAMNELEMDRLPDPTAIQKYHQFGINHEELATIFAITFP